MKQSLGMTGEGKAPHGNEANKGQGGKETSSDDEGAAGETGVVRERQ